MSHQLLDRLKRAIQPDSWRRLPEFLSGLLGGRTPVLILPRGEAHWLKLGVKGIPPRFVPSSLRLQLRQLLGDEKFGFAYSVKGDAASLWYWSESDGSGVNRLLGEKSSEDDFAPWPESLLRSDIEDGLHLIKCLDGFEAVSVVSQEIRRTRWFASVPTSEAWAAFVRDAGMDARHHPMPEPRQVSLKTVPARGWKLSTGLIQPIPPALWAGAVAAAVAGLLVVMGGAYGLKLDSAISAERANYERLSREHAVTIALQKKIDEKINYLKGFSGLRSSYSQLELMTSLVNSGVISEGDRISLSEWEFRNNRIRMLFFVPQEGFSLGLFLSVLEKQPVFRDIKLMTDTSLGTVGIQALVVPPSSPETLVSEVRTDRTPVSGGR